MEHWYVYYKLPREKAEATASRVHGMLEALAANAAVHGRLLKRVDNDAHTMTLMEQYERIADPQHFATELAQAVASAGLPDEAIAQRRIERFEDC